MYSKIRGYIPRQFRNIRGIKWYKIFMSNSQVMERQPYLAPASGSTPMPSQDHIRGTHRSKNSLCTNSGWQQLIEQFLSAHGSWGRPKRFLTSPRWEHPELLHQPSFLPGIWGSKGMRKPRLSLFPLTHYAHFLALFMSINHQQPLLNAPLFVTLDSAWAIMPEKSRDCLMSAFNMGQVLFPPSLFSIILYWVDTFRAWMVWQ